MRKISFSLVSQQIYNLVLSVNFDLPFGVVNTLRGYLNSENTEKALFALDVLLKNATIAKEKRVPLCQDCGTALFFVEIGHDVYIEGGSLEDAINSAVSLAYQEGSLRKSIVLDPILRKPLSSDNTPSVIWHFPTKGDTLKIHFMAKGGGSENVSSLFCLDPGTTSEEICDIIFRTVFEKAPNACPPVTLGIAIGGTTEQCAVFSKKALLRNIGERSHFDHISQMETDLLSRLNSSGIGPGALGGKPTAIEVFIEALPCHIASLPLFISLQCNSSRHGTITL